MLSRSLSVRLEIIDFTDLISFEKRFQKKGLTISNQFMNCGKLLPYAE